MSRAAASPLLAPASVRAIGDAGDRRPLSIFGAVAALYGSVGDDPSWCGVAERIHEDLAADYVALTIRTGDASQALSSAAAGTLPAIAARLDEALGERPPEAARWFKLSLDGIRLPRCAIAAVLGGAGGLRAELTVLRAQALTVREQGYCDALLPYFVHALDLCARFAARLGERHLLASALDDLRVGVAMLDGSGGIVSANRTAWAIFDRRDYLRVVGRRLICETQASDRRLREAIAIAAGGGVIGRPAEAIAVKRRDASTQLGMLVLPVAAAPVFRGTRDAVAALLLRDAPEGWLQVTTQLRELFGLTPAEANVTAVIVEGLSSKQVAARLGMSHHTVRSHLRSIFCKLGVKRQTDLLCAIMNSIVAVSHGSNGGVRELCQ